MITAPSHPKYLAMVRAVTVKMGLQNRVDSEVIQQMEQAVDEACSNVIAHAYAGDPNKQIAVTLRITRDAFEVVIEDSGRKADLASLKGRGLDEIRPGGLGVHFIKRACDVVKFDENREKGNRLVLIKHLTVKGGNKDKRP
ncbi:MAG TPA: ATP-binding protein [Thermodesulfovibrionales bacterium]|nr:ATP-binding protein [Thermodesulfovibrionales bacterium]